MVGILSGSAIAIVGMGMGMGMGGSDGIVGRVGGYSDRYG